MPARYDLHTHSVRSDGTTTPREIAEEAEQIGLSGFALTDHDTVEGWDEARETAARVGIDFLPGMEITTKFHQRSTHLLAYGIRPDDAPLNSALSRVLDSRAQRAREMVELLAEDFDIDWAAVVSRGEDRTLGRPHIADALVEAGYFSDRGVAFAEVLHPRSPYYLPTYAIDTVEAIRLVRGAGGVAVLAHPAAGRMTRPIDLPVIEELASEGLWGIELDHPENRTDWLPQLRELATLLDLRVTGASDYHGAGKSNKLGQCTSSRELWEEIRRLVAVKH